MRQARLLVVDDEKGMRDFLSILLRKEGYDVVVAGSGREALERLAAGGFDLVVSDIRMPDLTGLDLLREVRASSPDTLVVLITAYATAQTAISALKLGAHDYLTKPFDVEEFKIVVHKALERKQLQEENRSLRQQLQSRRGSVDVIGRSEAIRRVLDLVDRVADTPATILLTGERGTGKEVLARAIHGRSRRRERKFVSVNCAAIQESLLESELFGHVRGAFTGATSAHEGLFETAQEGTLLLDEVGEMSANMQAKLLRALQEKRVRRVGGSDEVPVDVRVIASTNRDLQERVRAGAFRADLFDRLNVIRIDLPPLRERREDIALLAEHFLRALAREMGRPAAAIAPAALQALERHDWPGNVRELENVLQRAVALSTGELVDLDALPEALRRPGPGPAASVGLGEAFDMEGWLDEQRRRLIREALERSGGRLGDAARLLGITFRAIRYYAKKYEMRRESFERVGDRPRHS